ncbi:MAG: DUF6188 family protein [Opitutaceae bacterium]
MHGLSSDIDLSSFAGVRVEQICFGENEIIIRFSREHALTIESAVEVCVSHGCVRCSSSRAAMLHLGALFGKVVLSAKSVDEKHLRVEFECSVTITCEDSNDAYESYSIKMGERILIV